MLYTNLRDAKGAKVALRCEAGKIVEVGPGLTGGPEIDGGGRLLMPAFVEPHVHLDKTLYGEPWRASTDWPGAESRNCTNCFASSGAPGSTVTP